MYNFQPHAYLSITRLKVQNFYLNMAFRRSFNPEINNSRNVKGLRPQQSSNLQDGTSKSNDVARKDLAYWIPVAGPFLHEGVSHFYPKYIFFIDKGAGFPRYEKNIFS